MATGAAMELMLTMRPPPALRMIGSSARLTRTMPKKLASNRACASAVSVNSTAPEMPYPALLITRSTRPSRCKTVSTAAATAASSVTSQVMCRTPCSGFSRRDSSYTVHPCCDRASAVSRPMPELPPVTMAILAVFIKNSSRFYEKRRMAHGRFLSWLRPVGHSLWCAARAETRSKRAGR